MNSNIALSVWSSDVSCNTYEGDPYFNEDGEKVYDTYEECQDFDLL